MDLVRTQVQLAEDQYRKLKQEAHRRGVSMSALLREILGERYTRPRRSEADIEVGLRMVGVASDTADDVAERHDDYLYGDRQ
jgi:predicted DNA-binding ribbon-helix-helix protein